MIRLPAYWQLILAGMVAMIGGELTGAVASTPVALGIAVLTWLVFGLAVAPVAHDAERWRALRDFRAGVSDIVLVKMKGPRR